MIFELELTLIAAGESEDFQLRALMEIELSVNSLTVS
jgi:hypothetical protein